MWASMFDRMAALWRVDSCAPEQPAVSSPGMRKAKQKMTINDRFRAIMGDILSEEELEAKLKFGQMLGTGATSKVYEAVEHTTGQRVAVKVFDKAGMVEVRRSMAADGEYVTEKATVRVRRRLLKVLSELEISSSLDHPNIIQYLGAYETTHRICIVYELVKGSDLLDYLLKHGRMEEAQAARVFRQLLAALEYCHARHIYHRDLKLENVLITHDFQVKLIDFGLAEKLKAGETLKTICGTPLYCSPEVLFMSSSKRSQGFHGAPADVWSVGVLIFALLTGCAPFDDSTFARLRQDVYRRSIMYPSHMSDEVKGLLKAILILDPHLRPRVGDIREFGWIKHAVPKELARPASSPATEHTEAVAAWTPTAAKQRVPCRTFSSCFSGNDTEVTTSSSTSFEAVSPVHLEKTTKSRPEEPQSDSCSDNVGRLSCLERDLEEMVMHG